MALKRNPDDFIEKNVDASTEKARQLFSGEGSKKKETKILTTFSIEPSTKRELEELFSELGLSWAGGIRFALKEFYKKHKE